MLVLHRKIGESLLIEDVQLTLIYTDLRSIIFSMQKLSGGRETKVRMLCNQIVDVCYDVRFQLLSVNGQTAHLVLEYPESVSVQATDGTNPL